MNFLDIILLILPIILPAIVGYLLVKAKIVQASHSDILLQFLMYVTLPAIIILNLSKTPFASIFNYEYSLATIVGTLLFFVITLLIHRFFFKKNLRDNAFAGLNSSFVSASIIGIPLLASVFGIQKIIIPALLNTILALLTIMPITIALAELYKSKKGYPKAFVETLLDLAKNPLTSACAIGLGLSYFQIPLPLWLADSLDKTGSATFALALGAVGMTISLQTFREKIWEIGTLAILKMLIFPVLAFILAVLFKLTPTYATIFVLIMSLPTAKAVLALSEEYDKNYEKESADIITITTLLCIITFPIAVLICHYLWPEAFYLVK